MSVIQKIREKAAWIVTGAIGVSLLAFIIQDAFYHQGSLFGNGSTVGKINGKSIEREDFDAKINFYDQANNGQIKRNQLVSSVWDFMVNQIVIEQQADKLGLTVTSGELSDILFGNNPPQWMQQAFTDPKTGVFNAALAKQQFAAIKNKTNDVQVKSLDEGYIQPTILQTLGEKYQALITGAVYVPKWMSEKMSADANSVAKASYVYVPYTSISDSSVKVSTDEMEAYIKKHATLFKHDQTTRTISYVSFSALPSKDDSAALKNQLESMKADFASTHDESTFLTTKGSESQYYNSFIGAKEIKQPIKDTLFKQPVGSVYGPYLDGGNYVLAKIVAEQSIPDSVKARHILVATTQQDPNTGSMMRVRDDSAAKKRLDSAVALLKTGVSFDSVALKYSDDPGSKSTGGVYNFPSGQMDENFNDFSFTGKPGETKIVKTVFGYHYIEILNQSGSETGYKIAYLAKPIEASTETDNAASNAASQFAAASRNSDQFQANAKKQNLPLTNSQEFGENDFNIPGIGESRTLVKWAYNNKVGSVSEPEEIDNKYVVAMVTSINEKGTSSVQSVRQTVEPIVRNEKKAQIIINTQMKGSSLQQVSASAHQPVKNVDSVSFNSFLVPELGNEPNFIGAAFNKQLLNKMSAPIAGNQGVFTLQSQGVTGVSNIGQTAETQKTQIEQMLKQQSGQEINTLKKAADIKDYRSKFY